MLGAAAALLGSRLVREVTGEPIRIGRIVELEAYGGPDDRASHARAGLTVRTAPMFGPPGRAYVYLVYGMYHCLNIVTGPDGDAAAVLVRALEPVAGIELMRAARAAGIRPGRALSGVADARLAAGPGLLCQAMGVGRWANGLDLCNPTAGLRLERAELTDRSTNPVWSRRIGIDHAGEPWTSVAWRLADAGSPSLSAPAGR